MKIKSLSTFYSIFLSAVFLLNLTSCATLSESECISADWEIIGLEDGSLGRDTSYIGQHRQACAKYNVAPNLEAYLKGHEKGTRNFCTGQNGYNQGIQGRVNNNTCPADLANTFEREYQRGYRVFTMGQEINRIQASIAVHDARLIEIADITKLKEEELVRDGTSKYRRRILLDEIKELERESEAVHIEIDNLRVTSLRLEEDYQRLMRRGY